MIEMAMVFDMDGHDLFWKGSDGCSAASIEDSQILWYRIWQNRGQVGGVAHTHPWEGSTSPSITDLTTFAAIEAGLGRPLLWPIVTMTHVNYFCKNLVTNEYIDAGPVSFRDTDWWMKNIIELRRLSRGGDHD